MRRGKVGVGAGVGVGVEVSGAARALQRRGVRRCACMWWIPRRGMPRVSARPFAVSRPVERQARMPGPRVAEMKVGFMWRVGVLFSLGRPGRGGRVKVVEESCSSGWARGKARSADWIRGGRLT